VRLYNSYIITVALTLLLTTVILIALGQNSLNIYYTIYLMEALIITELYAFLNSRARRQLTIVGSILFGGFAFVLCWSIIEILT